MLKTDKKQELINSILNHPVQGEVYILTPGRIWKALVLKYFNKVKRGEVSINELITILEEKGGVKYGQKHSLVRYPIEECLKYISKLSKQDLDIK